MGDGRFRAVKGFKRCLAGDSLMRETVLRVGVVECGLSPELLVRNLSLKRDEHRSKGFTHGLVESFRNAVGFGGVSRNLFLYYPLLAEVPLEFIVDVLTAVVTSECLDGSAVLGLDFLNKVFDDLRRLRFLLEESDPGDSCGIVNEGDVVASTTEGGNWERSTEVGMNQVELVLSARGGGTGFGVFRFRESAGFAMKRVWLGWYDIGIFEESSGFLHR